MVSWHVNGETRGNSSKNGCQYSKETLRQGEPSIRKVSVAGVKPYINPTVSSVCLHLLRLWQIWAFCQCSSTETINCPTSSNAGRQWSWQLLSKIIYWASHCQQHSRKQILRLAGNHRLEWSRFELQTWHRVSREYSAWASCFEMKTSANLQEH